MGYHLRKIEKGELGEFSKIREEFEELADGVEQQNPVLILVELSDLIGAIEHYAKKWNVSIEDLIKMNRRTQEAFTEGRR